MPQRLAVSPLSLLCPCSSAFPPCVSVIFPLTSSVSPLTDSSTDLKYFSYGYNDRPTGKYQAELRVGCWFRLTTCVFGPFSPKRLMLKTLSPVLGAGLLASKDCFEATMGPWGACPVGRDDTHSDPRRRAAAAAWGGGGGAATAKEGTGDLGPGGLNRAGPLTRGPFSSKYGECLFLVDC